MYPFTLNIDDPVLLNILKRAKIDRVVPLERIDPHFSSMITREFKAIRKDVKIVEDVHYRGDKSLILNPNVDINFYPNGKKIKVEIKKLF